MWTCPQCGARLVTRNLWHSCGRFTLEALFGRSDPQVLTLARRFVSVLRSLGNVQVLPQKTRLVCVARVRFAGLTPRKDHFVASFALRRQLTSRRIIKHETFGPRWHTHSIRVRSADDIDDELRGWLQESHDLVGMQRARRRTARAEREVGEEAGQPPRTRTHAPAERDTSQARSVARRPSAVKR